ncbi:retrovirus-related pol polyprotein from transposon TNT 1-94 [Tanacetum coccineum]
MQKKMRILRLPIRNFINVSRAQTKGLTDSLQNKLNDMIYENMKIRAQLSDKVSKQKDTTKGTSVNTQFCKQSILGKPSSSSGSKLYSVTPFLKSKGLPKIDESHALSKPVTSNSVPTPQESRVMKNDKVITLGMFRINPFMTFREDKFVPINKVRASVDNAAKTRRPQPKSNTNNDRAPSASKSSCIKNKEVEVEEHHRNLLLSKNKKHMSSRCNNVKLVIRNDNLKLFVLCKQKENILNTENQMKQKPKVKKPKKVGSKERLASPTPSEPSICRRWSPTGRLFDCNGKIIKSRASKGQSDNSKGYLNLFMARRLGLLQTYDWESKASHQFRLEVFRNWHNLFSVWQFCDSYLEVAFRRNLCFIKNLKGVDLLKGNRTTNLYTINIHEMAFASPICLKDHATSTKSWLWHQRLSHLNFDTINDLAKNDLVTGLPKFKYHKKHLCPSCEQGKSKKESQPSKPIPNSKQRLHLFHMDLRGPMRVESINGKRYVLVIVDDYSRYMWVHFLRSKDKAPEEIKTFFKKITVLLQALVIIVEAIVLRATLKTAPSFIDDLTKHHTSSLTKENQISHFYMYLGFSIIPRMTARTLESLVQKVLLASSLLLAMDFEQSNSKPGLQSMTSGQISSGLALTYAPSTITAQQPTERELDLLFETMYDDYIGGQPSAATRSTPAAQAPQFL